MVIKSNESVTVEWYYDKVTDMEISSLFKFVKPYLKDKRVLDLGCGTGRYLEFFSKDSIGIDASYESIKIVKKKGLNIKFGDLNQKLNFHNDFFDIVFCSHILEHVESPIGLLKECNRILKKNGLIFIILPNETNLPNLIGLDNYFGNHPEHLYSFSIKNTKILLSNANFNIMNVFIAVYLIKRFMYKSHLGNLFLNFVQKMPRFIIYPFSDEYMIIGKK